MKVLLVGDYPPPYGGIAVQVQHLKRTLPEAGVECRVLNIGRNRGISSADYESMRGPMDFLRKLIRYARSGYLLHLFTNGENWKSWGMAFAVGVVGRLVGTPAAVTITSGGTPAYLTDAPAWVRSLARVAVKLPAALVCRTDAIARSLRPWRTAGLAVIPAFSLARLRPAESLPETVARFASLHRPLLVSVAILRREYDLPTLLQAFRALLKAYPAAGLVVVGAGEEETKVRDLVELWKLDDSVLLTGWVPHDDCMAIMRDADVFVRTTLYDGDASSVREALALGVPVVATRTDFRPEGVVLCPPANPEALFSVLAEVLARRDRRTTSGPASPPPTEEVLLTLYRNLWNGEGEQA